MTWAFIDDTAGFAAGLTDLVEAEDRKPCEHKMLYHLLANPHYASLFTGSDRIRFLKEYISSSGLSKDWPSLCRQISPLLSDWHQKWHAKNSASAEGGLLDPRH